MGTLAGMLKSKGHIVAGSDQGIYPPMSDMLKEQKIKIFSPYNKLHVKQFKPDIVIIGNTIKRGNPELEYVISNGQIYRSLPDILREEIIEDKKTPIVITGTHGKTTTTALIFWILEVAGLDPTIFCGGFMRNIDSSFRLGKGKHIVIEGDEYTTSFFDKNPKFLHYCPHIGVINNIDHDHLDVYETLNDAKEVFSKFINLIPSNGKLIINADNKNINDIIKDVSCETFGIKQGGIVARNIKLSPDETSFDVNNFGKFHMKLAGEFNVYNCLAAISTSLALNIPVSQIKKAIATFDGVARRAELLGEKNGKMVINDYAHHPTAVRETLKAIKAKFHGRRIIALFEPGSSSSRMKIFEKPYVKALANADISYIYKPFFPANKTKTSNNFSQTRVSREITKLGKKSRSYDSIDKLLFNLKQETRSGDVLVIMSCRDFDGLKDKIWTAL